MHRSFVPVWSCLLASLVLQSAELPPDLATLGRIKTRMSQTLVRQPDYTCIQQVERSQRLVPKHRFELHDMLRLEVALVDGKEMYAWPGAHKFEETDLTDMVNDGAIGSGSFATFARAVFQSNAPTFKYVGIAEMRGRQTVRYDFVVPLLLSGYHIRARGAETVVGYRGSFWADPSSGELVRLEVIADDIPPSIGVSKALDVMDYERMKIGESEFLLPVAAELRMTDLAGNENRNRTQFTSCKQYTGESIVRFAEAPEDNAAAMAAPGPLPPVKEVVEVPANLDFQIRLLTDIDSTTAAVGDPVSASLDQNIKQKHRVLFQKGAHLLGRILRFEQRNGATLVDLQFTEIESDTQQGRLMATLASESFMPPGQTIRSFRGYEPHPSGSRIRGLLFRSTRLHLRPGFRLRLHTAPRPTIQDELRTAAAPHPNELQ